MSSSYSGVSVPSSVLNSSSRGGRVSEAFKKGSSSENKKSITINIESVIEKIKSLKKHSHTPINKLDKNILDTMNEIRDLGYVMRKNAGYSKITNSIKETFGNIKNINPGTVAAFFYGCFLDTNFEGSLSCSSYCAGAMPLPDVPGWESCKKNVAVYTEDGLSITHTFDGSDNLILHVSSNEFSGISKEEAEKLKKMGIKNIAVFDPSGNSRSSDRSQSVDSFCNESSDSSNSSSSFSRTDSSNKSEKSSNSSFIFSDNSESESGGIIIGIIIILIIFIILAFCFYYYYNNYNNTKSDYSGEKTMNSMAYMGPGIY